MLAASIAGHSDNEGTAEGKSMKQHDHQVPTTARETAPLAAPDTDTPGTVWEPPPGPSSVPWSDVYPDEHTPPAK